MPFIQHVLRFADADAWSAVVAAGSTVALNPVGTLFAPAAPDAPEEAAPEALPGYHVIVVVDRPLPASWAAAALISPPASAPLFSGVPNGVPTIAAYQMTIDAHVQATAQARSYNDGASCAGYVASTVPAWAEEATAFIAWRDAVYVFAFDALAAVQAGGPPPTVEALIASLPAMEWPA
jgi:hypothetical protein